MTSPEIAVDITGQSALGPSRNIFFIWLCFAVTDGLLMLGISVWQPSSVAYYYPWLAFIASCMAVAYSRQLKGLLSRLRSSFLPLRSVAIATLSSSLCVLILRNLGYARLSIPHGSILKEFAFVFSIAALVPLGEEFVFRGIILEQLLGQESIGVAVAMSAMGAAICHDGFILAFTEHVVISGVYLVCGRSLRASVMAHAVLNATAMLPGLSRWPW